MKKFLSLGLALTLLLGVIISIAFPLVIKAQSGFGYTDQQQEALD